MVKNLSPGWDGTADLRRVSPGHQRCARGQKQRFPGQMRAQQRASAVDRIVAMRQHANEPAGHGE
jgi:hypothetical protein